MPGKKRSTAAAAVQPVTRRRRHTSMDRLVPKESSDIKLNHLLDEPVKNSGDSNPAEPAIGRTRRLRAACREPGTDGNNKDPQITSAVAGFAADSSRQRISVREKNRCCSTEKSGRESVAQPAEGMDSEGAAVARDSGGNQPLAWPLQGLPPRGSGAELPTACAATWRHLLGSQQLCQAVMRRSVGLTLATAKKERMALEAPLMNQMDKYKLHSVATPFTRRITAMAWHPTKANLLAAGSKGGELALWNVDKEQPHVAELGIGPGGVIQAMKFWPTNRDSLLSATMDCGIVLRDLTRGTHSLLYDVDVPYQKWLCSVDANSDIIAGGDSYGTLVLLSGEGKKIFSSRVHKSKITHVEFCPVGDYLLCTASVDRTVKLWDFRNMKDKSGALCELQHDRGINSACFSKTNGYRLLTTDQHDQIRIYASPTWSLEEKILHPHRFFQHLTPIKASWHPLVDVAIIGRYPEQKDGPDKRRLDTFRADNGQLAGYIYDPNVRGISSLNHFNATADYLSSGMGSSIVIWKKQILTCEPDSADDSPTTSKTGQGQDGLPRGPKRPKRPSTSKQDAAAAKAKLARK